MSTNRVKQNVLSTLKSGITSAVNNQEWNEKCCPRSGTKYLSTLKSGIRSAVNKVCNKSGKKSAVKKPK